MMNFVSFWEGREICILAGSGVMPFLMRTTLYEVILDFLILQFYY